MGPPSSEWIRQGLLGKVCREGTSASREWAAHRSRPFSRLWWKLCPRETAPIQGGDANALHVERRPRRRERLIGKLHDGQHLAVCTAFPVCVVLNTCRLRSDDLLTFACVPAEEMLLWFEVPQPYGGSPNQWVRDRRAVHFSLRFSSEVSRMSCTTCSERERSPHSQGVSTGCPGERLRRNRGAPKILELTTELMSEEAKPPSSRPAPKKYFFLEPDCCFLSPPHSTH